MTYFSSTGPSTGDLCYRGSNGQIGIREGTFATRPIGFAIINYTYLTNSQSLAVVLGDEGYYDAARTFLYTHSNTTHTQGAYCALGVNHIEIGTYIRSAGVYTYTSKGRFGDEEPFFLLGHSTIEFRNVGAAWNVLADNKPLPLLGSADMSAAPMDASHRSAAISMERRFEPIRNVYTFKSAGDRESVRIYSLVFADMVQPSFVGSGAKMRATGIDSINTGSTGGGVVINNFFTGVDTASEDIAFDPDASRFIVSIRGYYKIVLRTKNAIPDGPTFAGIRFAHILFVNANVYESGSVLINTYDGTTVTWKDALQSSWTVYLQPGDNVYAGYSATGALTSGLVQDDDGLENVFSIALLTRNLL